MAGELRRHFRDRGWAVRPPRSLQERALMVERAADELLGELGRSPTVGELAERTDLDAAAVLEAREALNARASTSLSAGDDGEDGVSLDATIGSPDSGFRRAEERVTLAALSAVLTAREREVVRLRFDEDRTQAEIGRMVGLSQMHVSRVLRCSLEKLREAAGTEEPEARAG
jgi:RNA polymerase sigma-B factor